MSKANANANAEALKHTADHDIGTPEMKINKTTNIIPVSDSSKSEVNRENKDVMEQTLNQKSSLVAMMKNASAIATAQSEREAFPIIPYVIDYSHRPRCYPDQAEESRKQVVLLIEHSLID